MISIWVIVDQLSNTSQFIAIKITWSMKKMVEMYIRGTIRLQGVPRTIISDMDTISSQVFGKSYRRHLVRS